MAPATKKLDLAALTNSTRTVKVRFNGATINVTYHLSMLNKDFYERVRERDDDNNPKYQRHEYLADIIERWDITNDGEPVDVTKELLEELPEAFVQALDVAIFEDATPKALTR